MAHLLPNFGLSYMRAGKDLYQESSVVLCIRGAGTDQHRSQRDPFKVMCVGARLRD